MPADRREHDARRAARHRPDRRGGGAAPRSGCARARRGAGCGARPTRRGTGATASGGAMPSVSRSACTVRACSAAISSNSCAASGSASCAYSRGDVDVGAHERDLAVADERAEEPRALAQRRARSSAPSSRDERLDRGADAEPAGDAVAALRPREHPRDRAQRLERAASPRATPGASRSAGARRPRSAWPRARSAPDAGRRRRAERS